MPVPSDRVVDVTLLPGEYCVARAGSRVRTLLGSCVSITLWQPQRRIGAMSHILLSRRPKEGDGELDGRYAGEALSLMLRDLARWKIAPEECQAKLFGGGNMFPQLEVRDAMDVGQRNGETARELVRARGIPVVSESLFGIGYRMVIFEISSGRVWSRHVQESPLAPNEARGASPREPAARGPRKVRP